MSQSPHQNSDLQQPDVNSSVEHQAEAFKDSEMSAVKGNRVIQGNQNRAIQGSQNRAVQGDGNNVIQGDDKRNIYIGCQFFVTQGEQKSRSQSSNVSEVHFPKQHPEADNKKILAEKPIEKKVNFENTNIEKLEIFLNQGEWQKADEETLEIMSRVSGKNRGEYWTEQNIKQLPCKVLCKIDKLWREASEDCFGFSVQKSIWEEVANKNPSDEKTKEKFAEKVGWYDGREWRARKDTTFMRQVQLKNKGILPTPPPFTSPERVNTGLIPSLVAKLNKCNCD